jgi:hypothetical protein
MFSTRTNWPRDLNPLAAALERRRGLGLPILDLTESNPTQAGFIYPSEEVLNALAHPAAMQYEPSPRGLRTAREAIARYYSASDVCVDPERIVLASGTSEAYSHALRLLANPGDEILRPVPSYPLFEFLADLNDVQLVDYPLLYDHGWRIDLDRLRSSITGRSRAIIVVNPNNPTGSYLRADESAALVELARSNGLALIVDEVFWDYAWDVGPRSAGNLIVSAAQIDSCLTFTLNGLSKLSALPQMKLAWTVVNGPSDVVGEALARLEVITDTYLTVGTPVQHAAPSMIEQGERLRRQVQERTLENLALLDGTLGRGAPMDRLEAEGGWYAVLRLPRVLSDEQWAIHLLEADGVYVHPGHFFGFPHGAHLVLSLLPQPGRFREGIEKIAARVAQSC